MTMERTKELKHNRTLLHKDSSQEEKNSHKRRPRRPPFLRVLSVGTGVTSSMRPIFKPERESARRADCPPGPGLFVLLPPVARILICRAVSPSSCGKKKTWRIRPQDNTNRIRAESANV